MRVHECGDYYSMHGSGLDMAFETFNLAVADFDMVFAQKRSYTVKPIFKNFLTLSSHPSHAHMGKLSSSCLIPLHQIHNPPTPPHPNLLLPLLLSPLNRLASRALTPHRLTLIPLSKYLILLIP
jgi:hypothetical protein